MHWTSHYLAIRQLLDLRQYIVTMVAFSYDQLVIAAGKERKAKMRAEKILAYMNDSLEIS